MDPRVSSYAGITLSYYYNFVVSFKALSMDPLVLFQDSFASSASLDIPCDYSDQLVSFCSKASWDLAKGLSKAGELGADFLQGFCGHRGDPNL